MERLKTKEFWLSDAMVIGYFALFNFILHLFAIKGFGYFRDEFYYISCSDHLAFGYVDQPPLAAWLLRAVRTVLGSSVVAIRIVPIFLGAVFVFMTGWIARELGGGKFGLALAAATAFSPMSAFFMFNYYSMNSIDLVIWLFCFYFIIRAIKTGDSKYWLWFGLTAGIGLLNKISLLFLGFGIFVGLLLTKERKQFKEKYLWYGAALAGLLFLPYVLWNMTHDWAHLEFIHNAKTMKMAAVTPLSFLLNQLIDQNPITLLVWLPGLWFFFFNPRGKNYRLFGWMFIALWVLFTVQGAKAYYLSAAYPILFAGGALQWETWFKRLKVKWPGPALISFILIPTLFLCPIALPILPVKQTIGLQKMIGIEPASGERSEVGVLPQHYADMHGWEGMVEKVAGVYQSLPPEDQEQCIIFGSNYGVAGAIHVLGRKYNLPPVFSGHNNHFFWPPTGHSGKVMIVVGGRQENHKEFFREVTEVDRTGCVYCMPHENNKPIYLCRGPKAPLESIWPRVKHFI